jgi:hypothetical protein
MEFHASPTAVRVSKFLIQRDVTYFRLALKEDHARVWSKIHSCTDLLGFYGFERVPWNRHIDFSAWCENEGQNFGLRVVLCKMSIEAVLGRALRNEDNGVRSFDRAVLNALSAFIVESK